MERLDSYVEVEEGSTAIVVMKERKNFEITMEDGYQNWLEYRALAYKRPNDQEEVLDFWRGKTPRWTA